jgi:hypothetical protein
VNELRLSHLNNRCSIFFCFAMGSHGGLNLISVLGSLICISECIQSDIRMTQYAIRTGISQMKIYRSKIVSALGRTAGMHQQLS